ncbi:MAG: hypothetical protein A3G80_04875 [Betaproteobacteria bacterium RIFCSPLOWO2_12_FULL_62_13b]|nr:MAG: hypothetical protein A3G80_04875 [Betaproteobacteria bacterium RIFCSPLOWO2_12_FULL_62_13b]
MKAKLAVLEHRRRHIRAKIAAQRGLLERRMAVLRGPAAVFDKARSIGVVIHDHAGTVALAGSVVMFLYRRRLLSSALAGWRLARKVSRLFGMWKTATVFMRRHPAPVV